MEWLRGPMIFHGGDWDLGSAELGETVVCPGPHPAPAHSTDAD